jgi:asparagine synthase (glutamine-hydrolysing)
MLKNSISKRINGYKSVGSELSGGLDSAGVTAIANELIRRKGLSISAFSHVLAHEDLNHYFPFKDERSYSDKLASHIDLKQHIYCTDENQGILARLRETIVIQSGPTQQGFNIFSDVLYKNASKAGVELLLSGFGGDEGVSSYAGGFFDEMRSSRKKEIFKKEFLKRSEQLHRSYWMANMASNISYYIPLIHHYSHIQNRRTRDRYRR